MSRRVGLPRVSSSRRVGRRISNLSKTTEYDARRRDEERFDISTGTSMTTSIQFQPDLSVEQGDFPAPGRPYEMVSFVHGAHAR